jgi:hypothetical protein
VLEIADRKCPTLVVGGRVDGPPGGIMELMQKRARETAKKLDAEGRGILATDVYEVRFSEEYLG